jgi:catalase
VLADAGSDLAGIAALRKSLERQGAKLLVIAPVGGQLKRGRRTLPVDRTLATTRSVEFDAVLVAAGTTPTNDIKLVVLLQEAFRHCKALGAWGDGTAVLSGAGIVLDGPGVLVADSVGKAFTQNLVASLGLHRAWDRAIAVMASAVPPAA